MTEGAFCPSWEGVVNRAEYPVVVVWRTPDHRVRTMVLHPGEQFRWRDPLQLESVVRVYTVDARNQLHTARSRLTIAERWVVVGAYPDPGAVNQGSRA